MAATNTAVNIYVLLAIWLGPIAVFGMPGYRILQRAGLRVGFIGLISVPIFGLFLLIGVLAFRDWPNEPGGYR